MSEQTDEKLSALVDGELDASGREAAINALLKNAAARQRWERHHLISDALRHNLPHVVDKQLAARVTTALKDEATILAPRRREISSFSRRFAGLAVAASVATIGVLGVQFMYQNDGLVQPQGQIAQTPSQLPAKKQFALSGSSSGVQLVEQKAHTQIDPRMQQNLGKYLLDHNQQTARGVQGVTPYARIVTYPNTASIKDRNQEQR